MATTRRPSDMKRIAILLTILALASCGKGGTAQQPTSGIRGTTAVGPQCPVMQASSPCPDLPFDGTIRVSTPDGKVVEEVHTSADGTFEVRIDPGSYVVAPVLDGGGPPSAAPVDVEVTAGAFAQVTMTIDTGIR